MHAGIIELNPLANTVRSSTQDNDSLIDIIVNTPQSSEDRHDGYQIRTAAMSHDRTIITTLQAFHAAVQAIEVRLRGQYRVKSLQEWDVARQEGMR